MRGDDGERCGKGRRARSRATALHKTDDRHHRPDNTQQDHLRSRVPSRGQELDAEGDRGNVEDDKERMETRGWRVMRKADEDDEDGMYRRTEYRIYAS